MKTIGLIGGMSWESTATYYRLINQGIKLKLGGLHSAKIAMVSVDFAEVEALQTAGQWHEAAQILAQAAVSLQSAGADFFLICTNTMHKVAAQVQAAVQIPLLHIAHATAQTLVARGVKKVGLLGTEFTMQQPFYKAHLKEQQLEVLVPGKSAQRAIHQIIYRELCLGELRSDSRQRSLSIIDELHAKGAEAIVLGCTELALLVTAADTSVPLLDTTLIHAQSAVDASLQ